MVGYKHFVGIEAGFALVAIAHFGGGLVAVDQVVPLAGDLREHPLVPLLLLLLLLRRRFHPQQRF